MYFIYGIVTNIFFLISPVILFFRILQKKEDINRFQEKYCIYSKRNFQKTIWFHAVSVGELMSVIPVINKLENNKKIKALDKPNLSNFFLIRFVYKKNIFRSF